MSHEKLAIVMSYSGRCNDVMIQNKKSFERHNPEAVFFETQFNEDFVQSVDQANPVIAELAHRAMQSSHSAWRYCDMMLIGEFLKARDRFDKWLYVEWDVFCAVPVTEFFKEVWSFDVVTTSVQMPYREPHWIWFNEVRLLPDHLRPYACGVVPFAVTLFSNAALGAMTDELIRHPFEAFVELRIGTLANYTGFCPVPNPRSNHLSWTEIPEQKCDQRLIYHPVKRLLDPSEL